MRVCMNVCRVEWSALDANVLNFLRLLRVERSLVSERISTRVFAYFECSQATDRWRVAHSEQLKLNIMRILRD